MTRSEPCGHRDCTLARMATAPHPLPRRLALCCDYDGTLAHHGVVDAPTIAALERVAASGRRVLLVTGRELDDLKRVFPRLDLFDCVVAENGALLYTPATGEEQPLAEAPPPAFVEALRRRGVAPLSVGRCIVATWEPQDVPVMDTIRELGLELQITFNKGAVMVLPSGVNKASGLRAALAALRLSPHNAVGVGDAENDHAFLSLCGVAVAVANALPALKDKADIVTRADHGAGVVELVDELLADDLAGRTAGPDRGGVLLGRRADGGEVMLDPQYGTLLIAGRSGSGKSTVAKGWLGRLQAAGYSYCVIDPEGDYTDVDDAVKVGSQDHAVSVDEAMHALQTQARVVLDLLGIALEQRPAFLAALLPRVAEQRARTGQPHCLVIDEAHHMLSASRPSTAGLAGMVLDRMVLLTVHPDQIARDKLQHVDRLLVVGPQAEAAVRQFADLTGRVIALAQPWAGLEPGQALAWRAEWGGAAQVLTLPPSRQEHRRHLRKYAEGELPEDRSFYFRGPQQRLNLRARNLIAFLDLADGVDDETWLHHLRRGDYSRWFARDIKDEALAEAARAVEAQHALDAAASRQALRAAVQGLYTAPA